MINGFTLHDTTTAPTASTEILHSVQKSWGLVPNLHRVLAESPAALEAYATLWGIAEEALGYEDVFTKLEHATRHYEAVGLGKEHVKRIVR
jgi:hypothetical protein